MFTFPFLTIFFEGDGSGTPAAATPEPASPADPQVEPGQPPAQPGPAPWASDLERFPEEVRGDVDSYLRETWQPRVTQLEQQRSDLPDEAGLLWNDLNENPEQTFAQLAYEVFPEESEPLIEFARLVYGDEAVPYIEAALGYANGEQPGIPQPQGGDPADEFEIDLDPEDRALIDEVRAEREDQAFTQAAGALVEAYPDAFPQGITADQAKQVIAPFVVAEDGDLEAGFEAYQQWSQLVSSGAVTPGEAAEAHEAGEAPPEIPTPLTSADGTGGAPPTEERHATIHDAMNSFRAELRAKREAPPVL